MTGAEHRGFAWQLLTIGESVDSAELLWIGAELADVATMLDLGSEHESPADLDAVASYLRRRAARVARGLLDPDGAGRETR